MDHVVDAGFYTGGLKDTVFMSVLFNSQKTDFQSGLAVLRQAYQVSAGIYDYYGQAHLEASATASSLLEIARPLSTIAMHPTESFSATSAFHQRFEQYCDVGVLRHTGLNWIEFLSHTREDVEAILALCKIKETKYQKDSAARNRDIEQAMRTTR